MLMLKKTILLSITLVSLALLSCTKEVVTENTLYEWEKYEVSFDYSGHSDPFSSPESFDWKVYPQSEEHLVISKTEPIPVDMDFIYTRLVIYPNTDLTSRIEAINARGYKSVELMDAQTFSENTFTKVHIHSNILGEHDTNFYLMEFNGNILEYQAGVMDYGIIGSVLSSIVIE